MFENSIKNKLNTFFQLGVDYYFQSIHGSLKPKKDWVKEIIELNECLLIGNRVNDLEAARIKGIFFLGFNNDELISSSDYSRNLLDAL
jgi:hypothetical protein